MHIAENEEQSSEQWCEENGIELAADGSVVMPANFDSEAWLASLPPDVASEVREQLDTIEREYKESLLKLIEQGAKSAASKAATKAEELDLEEVDLTDADVQAALASRTPEMQALLTARPQEIEA
jgi:hypothetical protein